MTAGLEPDQHNTATGHGADGLDGLVACPTCDLVYGVPKLSSHDRALCARCHTVLIAPRRKAGKQLIALALTVLILIVAACLFPFLSIGAGGVSQQASILGTALAFSGTFSILSIAVLFFIVIIPALRLSLLIYVLAPIIRDRPPAPMAREAFALSESLLPWSMAEIFALGCAVALVKLSDMADVVFGPAAWIFAILVVLVVASDRLMCRYSIWKSLEN